MSPRVSFWPVLMLFVHGTTVLVWALAVPRLLGTGATLSSGTFVSFLLYTTMFVAPIEVIGQVARTMNRATTSAHRVFEVLDTEPEVRDGEFTGAVSGTPCFREGKVERLEAWLAERGTLGAVADHCQLALGQQRERADGEVVALAWDEVSDRQETRNAAVARRWFLRRPEQL